MVEPFLISMLVGGAGSLVGAILAKQRLEKEEIAIITQATILDKLRFEVERQNASLLINKKVCSYCGRVGIFQENCEGCGAPK